MVPVVALLGLGGGDGHDALALLAQAFGDELLDPQAELGERVGHADRRLVATRERGLAHREAGGDRLDGVDVDCAPSSNAATS